MRVKPRLDCISLAAISPSHEGTEIWEWVDKSASDGISCIRN